MAKSPGSRPQGRKMTKAEMERALKQADATAKREAAARKAAEVARDDTQAKLELSERALTAALEQQTATGEILAVIASSPTSTQPVFDAIADSTMRLMRGWGALVLRFDGELLHAAAIRGGLYGSAQEVRERFPLPPQRDRVAGEVVLSGEVRQIADVEADEVRPELRATARTRGWRAILS